MNTKIAYMDENNIDYEALKEAASIIHKGGLVAFPTETVYGLGANALDADAVKKIFIAKGRPQDNPLIIHVADYDIQKYAKNIPDDALKLMKEFWPGPLTLIFDKTDIVPYTTSAGLDTVGIRMPSSLIARELIKASGVPIAAPSANISGRPSPTDTERCIEDLSGKIDYIIGAGKCEVGLESTIVDCSSRPFCILRPGGITPEMLKEIIPDIYLDPSVMKKPVGDFRPKAPGMKYRHYAPKAPVKIIQGDLQKTIAKINEIVQNYIGENKIPGIIATEETKNFYKQGIVISAGSRKDLRSVAQSIFEILRSLDDKNVDVILAEAFPEEEIGIAIMNRLRKSAGFDIINV